MKRFTFFTLIAVTTLFFLFIQLNAGEKSVTSPSFIQEKNALGMDQKDAKEVLVTSTGEWELIFHDDFNAVELSKWNIIERGKNYNNELQFYKKENVEVERGTLRLIGKKEKYKNHTYTSGQITTKDKINFQYGRVEIKARYREGKGLFPAIWMLPSYNNKTLPEVDIFEAIGQEPNLTYMVNHYGNQKKYQSDYKSYFIKDYYNFHTYTLEWDERELRWYIDDQLRFSNDKGVPHEPMYLIINLAIGGNWPGKPNDETDFPAAFEIDHVKIYDIRR